MEERGLRTYDYNILVSHSWGAFRRSRDEIRGLLKDFGDEDPIVERTIARGVCGVKTVLDTRGVIRKVKALYQENPMLPELYDKMGPG